MNSASVSRQSFVEVQRDYIKKIVSNTTGTAGLI